MNPYQVPSPCIGQCSLLENICRGCGRTSDEIQNWPQATDAERWQIIEVCVKRKRLMVSSNEAED